MSPTYLIDVKSSCKNVINALCLTFKNNISIPFVYFGGVEPNSCRISSLYLADNII